MKNYYKNYNSYILILTVLILISTILSINIQAAEYTLHQGDQLGISVWGHNDLNSEVMVGPDGMISLPLIENIKVKDMTVSEVKKLITERYAEYIKNPQVNVLLKKYQKTTVMILGEVKNPGTYQLEENRRVLELISLAGGPTDIAAMDKVRLNRGDEVRTLNLRGLLEGRNIEDNYQLEDGDVIYLPQGIIEVTIMGEVRKPGRYQLQAGKSLTDLIAVAGGITEKADLELEYTTDTEKEKIKIADLLTGSIGRSVLKDGDMVYIPQGNFEVSILGEVQRPGTYQWAETMRLTDLLARAGNQTESGDIQKVRITHKDNSTEYYNLAQFFKNGTVDENPFLQAGDSVYLARGDFEVTVMGEVRKPGSYTWTEGQKLTDLLAAAGNQTEMGDLSNIRITHQDNGSLFVNLNDYLEGGKPTSNPEIKAGDSIYVGKKIFEVSILGEVNRPGSYTWNQDMSLDKLLAQAGNQKERGDLSNIKIVHQDGTTQEVNLEDYFTDSIDGENPLLKPGDTVRVEEVEGINWEKVFTYVTGAKLIKDFLGLEW